MIAVAVRLALFGALWLVLTRGRLDDPLLALASVGAATGASLALSPPGAGGVRVGAALGFAGYFLLHSFLGGWDVAWRALHPRMPLSPGFVRFRMRVRTPRARLLLAWTTSLLPGTATVGLRGRILRVHALDASSDVTRRLRHLERHVARLCGEPYIAKGDSTGRVT